MEWELETQAREKEHRQVRIAVLYGLNKRWARLTDPFVMGLMQPLVDCRNVQPSVDPVNAKVRGQQKHCHTEGAVHPWSVSLQDGPLEPGRPIITNVIVHQRLPPDFCYEPGYDECSDDRHRLERHVDLHPDLVLEESRVMF